jgi:hypothetical protein
MAPRRRANDKPRRADKEHIKECISPSLNLRFRSHEAAAEFVSIINVEEGNEERAWERCQVLKGKSMKSYVARAPREEPKTSPAKASTSCPSGGVKVDSAREVVDDDDDVDIDVNVDDDMDCWEVDEIIGKRKRSGLVEFLVK